MLLCGCAWRGGSAFVNECFTILHLADSKTQPANYTCGCLIRSYKVLQLLNKVEDRNTSTTCYGLVIIMTNDHFCSLDFHLINSFSCNNFNLSAHFTVTSRTPGETNQSCCGIIIRQVKIQNYIKLPLELASYFDASVACEQALLFGRAERASR